MKEGGWSEVLKLLLGIGALLALPVLIISSFPVDPASVNVDWAIYIFATELVLLVAILVLFLYKRMRRNDSVSP
jgi:Na+/phosphate symporter